MPEQNDHRDTELPPDTTHSEPGHDSANSTYKDILFFLVTLGVPVAVGVFAVLITHDSESGKVFGLTTFLLELGGIGLKGIIDRKHAGIDEASTHSHHHHGPHH